ncbi:MAG TPA: hypothetical protein VN812_22850, partial [Candidatus Acidoferrales bacterium]|nr:hypothetical protein [Candidatus Acidoferrales bacterium]
MQMLPTHCAPPVGVTVPVDVGIGVFVGVDVGVAVGVDVAVGVGVGVGVLVAVGVTVGVAVKVTVGVGGGRLLSSTEIDPSSLAVMTSLYPSPSTSASARLLGP